MQEGQRIAEESRRAGELDIDAIKASSIVFEGPLDALKYGQVEQAVAEPAPKVGGFVGDLADMVRELENCRAGHCEAAYKQNDIGGQARHVVGKIAAIVGQPMSPPLDRNVWSPANMGRVIAAVQELVNEVEDLRKKQPKTIAALHEALTHLGEGV
ncbi:hypothetical protein KGG73_gp50 [Streptomyces phage Sentinel]|uniref:Uncharacterized protein n=1 Tax=Streptomyces phage Sentinel TaxID=2767584 RepID=A0A873WVW4_9CAUD|nr:hypothetical protein KGG73_gp50 [Streptomyces phage Sentinel]QPB09884.1 hypothetical protein CPT_Sentinel_050 [Streptomyces phage Sentinel]